MSAWSALDGPHRIAWGLVEAPGVASAMDERLRAAGRSFADFLSARPRPAVAASVRFLDEIMKELDFVAVPLERALARGGSFDTHVTQAIAQLGLGTS